MEDLVKPLPRGPDQTGRSESEQGWGSRTIDQKLTIWGKFHSSRSTEYRSGSLRQWPFHSIEEKKISKEVLFCVHHAKWLGALLRVKIMGSSHWRTGSMNSFAQPHSGKEQGCGSGWRVEWSGRSWGRKRTGANTYRGGQLTGGD